MSPARQAGSTTTAREDVGRVADGRATRWEGHRQARHEELVAQARRSVHHRGPDVSMEEIAADAGTSKSLVYRYFADKTALQVEVARLVVRDIEEALAQALAAQATPREGLRAMVDVYLAMVESSPHVYAFVTADGVVEHFLGSVTELVAGPFARALADEADPTGGGTGGAPATGGLDGTRSVAAAGSATGAGTTGAGTGAAGTTAAGTTAAAWAAGAVGFVRGAGEWWLTHPGERPDRAALAAQVTSWLWAGPVGLLARGGRQQKEEP